MSYILNLRKYVNHEPLIMVCSGAIIIDNDKILLQRRKDNLKWAIHGGSMELGESLEETLFREVNEETGLKILNYQFFKTYSGKDFRMIYPNGDEVYLVDNIFIVDGFIGNLEPQKEEVLELRWFNYSEVPWGDLMEHNNIILKDYFNKTNKK